MTFLFKKLIYKNVILKEKLAVNIGMVDFLEYLLPKISKERITIIAGKIKSY